MTAAPKERKKPVPLFSRDPPDLASCGRDQVCPATCDGKAVPEAERQTAALKR